MEEKEFYYNSISSGTTVVCSSSSNEAFCVWPMIFLDLWLFSSTKRRVQLRHFGFPSFRSEKKALNSSNMYMHSVYIFMLKLLCLFLRNFPPYYVEKKK